MDNEKHSEKGHVYAASYGYDSADVLVATNDTSEHEWVVDSGCPFRLTPNKTWLRDFKNSNSIMVLFRNNKACKI